MPFHKQHVPGELIERIDGDVTALANFFSQFVIRVLGNALLVAGILLLLFREDVRVGFGLTLYALATLLILLAMQRLAVPRWAALRQARAEHFGFLEERLSGAEDIRAVGAELYVMRRLFLLMRHLLEKGRAAFVMGSLISNVTGLLFVIGNTVGLAVGVYLYTRGQATIGTAYLIVYYVNMLSAPLQNIREQALDLQQSTASIQRVSELFSLQPRVSDTGQVMIWPRSGPNHDKFSHPSLVSRHSSLPHGPLSVKFQNVSFRYEDDEPVLQDVAFHLQPGKVLGVLGRTGSGKTTLTRLLFRLYDPTEGLISLNSVDLREAALSDLRARVGMVTQDVQLFQA
ncbi:MAG: ATP-binding cassette domain-containing protein, partial [Longimicrobiales bacterium]